MNITRGVLHTIWAGALGFALLAVATVSAGPAYAQAGANELTQDEILGLQFMLEEEKLARDVYLTLGEEWGLNVFQNISRAEQTHMDAVASLLQRYGVDAALSDGAIGTFENQDLQALFDQLTASGGQSVADALLAGVAIEEIDILDLQEQLTEIENADIQRVYTSLLRGSGNHLRAFVSNVKRQTGETVLPQYLQQNDFDRIMNSSNGRKGNGFNGDGHGGSQRDNRGGRGPRGGRGGTTRIVAANAARTGRERRSSVGVFRKRIRKTPTELACA